MNEVGRSIDASTVVSDKCYRMSWSLILSRFGSTTAFLS